MKNIFIFLNCLICLTTFSQKERVYDYVAFNVVNSEYQIIDNAKVFVNGKNVPFDSTRQLYLLSDTVRMQFDVKVYCDGYDTLKYSQSNLRGGHTSFFRCYLWLIRPTEKYYYAGESGLKVPYTPHPDKLLVILNSRKFPRDDSLLIRFESEIKQYGLKINQSFFERPLDPLDQMAFNSYVGLEDRLIIQKEDGSDFDSDYCEELGYLRQLDMVLSAGPLLRIGGIQAIGHKYNVVTYDNTINVYRPERHYKSAEIDQIVKQIDERFYYDEKTYSIILPIETNEIIPQIMEKLKDLGFKGRMSMMIYFMVSKG